MSRLGKPLGVFANDAYVMVVGDSKLFRDIMEHPIAAGTIYEFGGHPAVVLIRRDSWNETDINGRVKRWLREYPNIELPDELGEKIKPRLNQKEAEELSDKLAPYLEALKKNQEEIRR